MERLDWLTYDTFSPYVGNAFEAHLGADRVQLVLVEATESEYDGGTGPDGKVRKQFRLEFRGAASAALEQATYVFTHPQVGEFPLFIVPIGADVEGMRYEAVFT